MSANPQGRKWALTINNPQECGLDHEAIAELLRKLVVDYWCMSDEIAKTGTYHTQMAFFRKSPLRFNTIKNVFPTAHIEKAYGSMKENRDYVHKTGKWADTEKAKTSVPGTFEEWGELPAEGQENSPKMAQLIENVKDGMTATEILESEPGFAFRLKDIDLLRQTLLAERFTVENRELEVTYLFGSTGMGKTRGIFAKHDPRDIYRVTNYRTGRGVSFDGYTGQNVLVFEEFASQIPIEEMLNYLDVYPLYLPARYADKVACYTKVYITSNLPITAQYVDVQHSRPETYKAFCRRIHRIVKYNADGTTNEHTFKKG